MQEIVTVTYIEDDAAERQIAEATKEKLETMGRLCILSPLYSDPHGADAVTPVVEPADMYVQGPNDIAEAFDLDLAINQ